MPTGSTLLLVRTQLRSEIGASSDTAQGLNSVHVWNQLLSRVQTRLYNDYDWPHLIMDQDISVTAGSRYSTFVVSVGTAGMNWDRVLQTWRSYSGTWEQIEYGICPDDYNVNDSIAGVTQDPIRKWMRTSTGSATYGATNGESTAATEQRFEVWPIPVTTTSLKFRGIRKLGSLITVATDAFTDTFRLDLDDTLVVLYAAAEWLTKQKSMDADAKLKQANAHYLRLKGNSQKNDTFVMGGGLTEPPRPFPRYGGRIV